MVAEEPALFDIGPSAAVFEQPGEKFWPGIAKWAAYKGAHQPCAVYVRLCQERGLAGVPKHLPATKKRTGPNGTLFTCAMCALEMAAADRAAEAEAERRRAAVTEATKAGKLRKLA